MAKLDLGTYCDQSVILSTEHSASSYGVPVAIIGGKAYGPDDIVDFGEDGLLDETAEVIILHRVHDTGLRLNALVDAFFCSTYTAPRGKE